MTELHNEKTPTALDEILRGLATDPDQLRSMFDDFPLGVIIADTLGIVVYYNNAHAEMDGVAKEEMLGRRWVEALIPLNGPNIMYVCQRMAKPVLGYVYSYKTYKGRVVNAAYWVYPLAADGAISGSICFTQPLAGQGRAFGNPPLQWPGYIPISDPTKNIIGQNPEFLSAVGQIKANAQNPFPILISGEAGSGKELLSKLAHQASKRHGNPYLALNCASIPPNLLEGLLFGTTKGGFTGAIDRPGMLSEAGGGTLYLDELDSMPMGLQPKLFQAIKAMKAARVGSSKEEGLDFKLVVSIGSDPREAMDAGRLSPDLFSLVAVVLVDIPPLRSRKEDLRPLTDFFISKYNNLLGKGALGVEQRLWQLMGEYAWPGNVRELERMVAGAVNQLAKGETLIGMRHVQDSFAKAFSLLGDPSSPPPGADRGRPVGREATLAPGPYGENPDTPYLTRLQAEERRLKTLLTESAGNVARAARKLGISRQLLN
ncbi:MAG: sigma 54-interacting transcriptional regulator, partial [Deltaproteobacteria bacterium]|nr:sigma 54-interacting transcriptional regulator [Deltaproteobacteria bacterium]